MGTKLTIDFETRSECDLRKSGAWKYSEHPSTEVICMAMKVNDRPPVIWINQAIVKEAFSLPIISTESAQQLLLTAGIIEAHNAEFEQAVYINVMIKKYDWPELIDKKETSEWRCSAAKAAAHALPRSLDGACKALNLSVQKDMEGHKIMMRLCKPKKPSKKDPSIWDEDPEKFRKLLKYCLRDVESEYAISESLRGLDPIEQRIWDIDQKINARGIYVDLDGIANIVRMVEHFESELSTEAYEITEHAINSPRQVKAFREWLKSEGLEAPNLQKQTVTDLLAKELPGDLNDKGGKVRRMLEIRQRLSKSSTSKFKKFLAMVCSDGRVRGTMMYHGASTGRWSGKGIQPQNMPRGTYKDSEDCLQFVAKNEYGVIDALYDSPAIAASKLIRAVIMAAPGHDLICADYKGIEMRVLAWLAGSTWRLKAIRENIDLYKVAAMNTYGVEYDDVTAEQRQVGKVEELALGYQGSWPAFSSMAKNYGVKPPDDVELAKEPDLLHEGAHYTERFLEAHKEETKEYNRDWRHNGRTLSETDAKFKKWAAPIVKSWRDNNPEIKQMWWDFEGAALEAVKSGRTQRVGKILFGVKRNFLWMRLPSGRRLAYYDPEIKSKIMPWKKIETDPDTGEEIEVDVYRDVVTYMGIDSKSNSKKWERISSHGGKWVENAVSGISRDIMAESMPRLEKAKYSIIMHVHDEILSEVPENFGSLEAFENLMATPPIWAKDCPIEAEGWRGKRYRK